MSDENHDGSVTARLARRTPGSLLGLVLVAAVPATAEATDYTSLSAGTYLLSGPANSGTSQDYVVSPGGDYELGVVQVTGQMGVLAVNIGEVVVDYSNDQPAYLLGVNSNPFEFVGGGFYAAVATIAGQQYLAEYWSRNGQPGGPNQQLVWSMPTTSTAITSPASMVQLGDNGAVSFVTGSSTINATPNWNVPTNSFAIQSVKYDFDDLTAGTPTNVTGDALSATNNTEETQTDSLQLGLDYTKTTSFAFTLGESVTLSVSSSTEVDVPGVAKETATWGLSETTNLSDTFTTTTSQAISYAVTSNLDVPPGETYSTEIIGTQEQASIPYTAYGTFTYSNGVTADGTTTGVFNGVDTGNFQLIDSCVSDCPSGSLGQTLPAPNGHYTLPRGYLPVPEPRMAFPLLAAGWGTLELLRRRRVYRRG
jgi:hypothetical protein